MSDTKTKWAANMTDEQRAALELAMDCGTPYRDVAAAIRAAFAAKPREFERVGFIHYAFACTTPTIRIESKWPGDGWVRCRIHGVEILGDDEAQP